MGFRVIQVDSSAGTAVNPAASTLPQVIKTYPLSQTDDEWISVYALFTITTTSSALANNIPLQIVVGPNTYSVTYTTVNTTAGTGFAPLFFKVISRAGDTINVQIGGGLTADTHASINVVAFYVSAESGYPGGT